MREPWTTHWAFETANFHVAFETQQEDMDPADRFEFDDDIAAVRNGDVEWFCARVAVYLKTDDGIELLGSDLLGGCAYKTVREFYTSHRDPDPMHRNCSIMRKAQGDNVVICEYFPSMVREAINYARAEWNYRKTLAETITLRKSA